MSNEKKIIDYIINECEMDLVGIADVSYFDDEPVGYRATDILPGAKSIIVYGKRLPDGGIQAAFRTFEDKHPVARASYGAFCADLAPNFSTFFHTFNLSQFIERNYGFVAMPLPCGPMQCGVPTSVPVPSFVEPFRVGLPLNIEKAAFAAGLGDYGWSGRLLTKEFGPRVQFGAVLTTMPLEYDKPYDGDKLCGGSDCMRCVKNCPVDAIPLPEENDHRTLGIKGNTCEVADIKLNRCTVAACALRKEFGGFDDYVANNNPSEAELEDAFKKKPINHWEGLDHYPKWKCDKCLIYCPTGNWHEKFEKRGLTKNSGAEKE